jgi:uncharacterized SAM-binding protein YcdF (DUF218 family)
MDASFRNHILSFAETLWNYHQMGHSLRRCDCIFVLGSHDLRVAERGAQLWLDGWAPWLLLSGGLGNLTRHIWDEPEADQFARIAQQMGVPADCILIENRSTNTGENILFSRELLAARGLDPHSFLLVQKPYMERRSFATFRKRWPEKDLIVTSPRIPLLEYPNAEISLDDVLHIMVGDFQRILLYPAKGFQIPQDVPDAAMEAYEKLIAAGYTRHLIRE